MAKTDREWRAARLAQMQEDPEDRHHGTLTGYDYGCRCERCLEGGRAAHREHDKNRKAAKKKWREKQKAERLARLMEAAGPRIVRIHGVGVIEI